MSGYCKSSFFSCQWTMKASRKRNHLPVLCWHILSVIWPTINRQLERRTVAMLTREASQASVSPGAGNLPTESIESHPAHVISKRCAAHVMFPKRSKTEETSETDGHPVTPCGHWIDTPTSWNKFQLEATSMGGCRLV